ncbi:TIGR04211 family SH3 domain-containing protein [Oceanisphaera arctica]|uniref:Arylsulfatase n=1 Tax=Oceanisphaera arctica TaxID=641510 RepID=A0A2P5TPC0_9GAMM|nr:TIGR04211 family SH3 domain-containing protein [Oceanisphaera arctica]PPL17461.1 arylsulfatase [Oceanisphaera arctica]GHA07828.1 SH3 domain protein [Oceanisphaera arctica]
MKSKLLVVLLCYLPWLGMAEAANRYISDNVYTYLRTGPSNQFRILGTVNAGEPVEQLGSDAETKYVQIRDAEGRTGWVNGEFVQTEESFRSRLPSMEEDLINTKQLLASVDERHELDIQDKTSRLQQQEQELSQVHEQLNELRQQHAKLETENQRLSSLMDDKEHKMRLDWLLNGGLVAGAGVLFGILLPMVPLRRRRNQGRWMN